MSRMERFTTMMPHRNCDVDVAVYLPTNYETRDDWDVLYCCDGQNIFEDEFASYGRGWRLHEKALDCVIIGVACAQGMGRLDEYSPFINKELQVDVDWISRDVGGSAELYLAWLLELKTTLEARYHIKQQAIVVGSSMGGGFALYAHLSKPQHFVCALCFSNAFWFAPEAWYTWVQEQSLSGCRVYLDTGLQEAGMQSDPMCYIGPNRKMFSLLQGLEQDLCYVEDPLGIHNEACWDARFDNAYAFAMKKKTRSS
ncbi:MAG: alpha/beta hydrolase [Erysipelotrichaceae bacterium]